VPLALADELFLMTHDLQSGKPRLGDPALGIGLAAGLLSELMFAGSLVVSQGQVGLGDYGPPPERLSEALYEQTRNELFGSDVSVRDWLASHRRLVLELIADRMVRAGELRREQVRRLGRSQTRVFPTKPSDAFIRAQRLPSYLRNRVEVTEQDVVLGALVALMAPGGRLMDLDDVGEQYLQQLLPALPIPLRELLSITESSIMAAMRNPHF
jgi:hypothetical protein